MKGAATREAILDAAVELGSLRGLEELTVGGLASTVEMSKSGLFAHFGSKQELQLATVAQAWEVFESHVLIDPRGGTGGDLGGLVERWLSFYERRVFTGGCFFVVAAVEFAGEPGPVRDALAGAVDGQIAQLEAAVVDAMEGGDLDARRDAGRIAFELHSILVGADALFHVRADAAAFASARATIDELLTRSRLPARSSGSAARSRRGG